MEATDANVSPAILDLKLSVCHANKTKLLINKQVDVFVNKTFTKTSHRTVVWSVEEKNTSTLC